jgi:uncharacterized protein (TIGR02145 family)
MSSKKIINFTTAFLLLFLSISWQACKKDDDTNANTPGSITDPRDGHTYRTITVNGHTWFAENLDYETEGSYKPSGRSFAFEGNPGRYYLYEAAEVACPPGWHLPTDGEWTDLELSVGMDPAGADSIGWRGPDVGRKLKSQSGWIDNNGTDDIDFTAIPAGFVINPSEGYFELWDVGEVATFWSSTKASGITVYYRSFSNHNDESLRSYMMGNYYPVRCMK